MSRHFRVLELLSPEDRDALAAFVREKNCTRTTDECLTWVEAHGYRVSRGAVWNWLDSFRMEESTRRAAEISSAYLTAAADTDPTAVASAALRKFQELILDYVVRADEADAGELMKLSIAMKTGVNTQQVIADMRKKQTEAVKLAETAAKSGKSATDVVATIKTALGIAA